MLFAFESLHTHAASETGKLWHVVLSTTCSNEPFSWALSVCSPVGSWRGQAEADWVACMLYPWWGRAWSGAACALRTGSFFAFMLPSWRAAVTITLGFAPPRACPACSPSCVQVRGESGTASFQAGQRSSLRLFCGGVGTSTSHRPAPLALAPSTTGAGIPLPGYRQDVGRQHRGTAPLTNTLNTARRLQ